MVHKTLAALGLTTALLVVPALAQDSGGGSSSDMKSDKLAAWEALPVFDQAGKKIGTVTRANADGVGKITDIIVQTDAGPSLMVGNEQFDHGTSGVTLKVPQSQLMAAPQSK
ncbi:hypothetical protein [Rhodospirillum rubrum]|uniref:PRC-barrel domain-containing protein n=1 Tax=Rhodospirillum rubrum (strain ATCC 11170 / ATH 1.1.1 / DSM 467 / LMG 4362 / NCIMB 8255 / S1) TaxID=269796 RepID=Q2RWX6_RHORT|nr:hypothetical protein [Rhodospirillum rubrum]ABC21369.1 hypothetical protein Rru_A0565 [Rhodospirillum rubrum ATCC 11170]AEO47049.1 hypothetical protein F11_02895 [Rhodospirillum rubrum F11]MBK5952955.1 hypothetical protein [Rhodospirillum rubrum]QXG81047.1 hypothetical protein KUL73_02940 [Rhodospirillum rubrum]HCF18481.1 hypothetical protein [Rhodospirillum rubrum]